MAKNKLRRRNLPASGNITSAEKIPLVSVIIPMYNSAKFIPQTLESLLYQTLDNFEAVVVDDCSTDDSVAVVESFSERFGGRLHLVKLRENTGTPGLPRNVGINISRGKYIAFLDSDDLYTKTALEELYTLAEKFSADVVSVDGSYRLWDDKRKSIDDPSMTDMNELTNLDKCKIVRFFYDSSLTEPTLKPENLEDRLKLFIRAKRGNFGVYSSFCKRDFLISNQIYFADMFAGEDQVFNFTCLCLAEKFLRVPDIFYIVRPRDNSIMRENFSNPTGYFRKRVSAFKSALIEVEKVMARLPFFKKHPNYRYTILERFAFFRLTPTVRFYAQTSHLVLNPVVEEEFQSGAAVVSAYLFDMVNIYQIHIAQLQHEIAELKRSR